jgi:hypothetical protein
MEHIDDIKQEFRTAFAAVDKLDESATAGKALAAKL